ncbi:MAG: glycoside hydrolase family 9 protein [Eubacterium sp.]|nr:glycoside hydrolase family 9 protein [Eubacterium sp.]
MIKKYLKKGMAMILAAALSFSLTACGSGAEKKDDAASGSAVSEEAAEVGTDEAADMQEEQADEEDAGADPNNLIEDGGFDGMSAWAIYKESGGSGSSSLENSEMVVSIRSLGEVQHAVQTYYDGFGISEGAEYELSFDARSTIPREILVRVQLNGGDYHAYFESPVKLTEQMQSYDYTFTMNEPSDPAPRLVFNMGYIGAADDGVGEHQIYFDNMKLILKDDSNAVAAEEVDPTGIRVNQVGYYPDDVKTAVLADVGLDTNEFKLIDDKGNEVYTGTLGSTIANPSADETDKIADFSDFTKEGRYRVTASGRESPEFVIAKDVYSELTRAAIKMLYMQRCGEKLDKKYAGKFHHDECHTEKAHLYWDPDVTIDVSGGWHDAGDYGRYVVAGAKAVADVLLAYESYSAEKIIDDVGTPYSGDGVDDLLQEAKYELDWLLKMQGEDGRVYHKVTCLNFPGVVMPEEETDDLIVSYSSTPATGDFAAVMAMAARIYGESGNASFKSAAKTYLKAAKKSWNYLKKQKDVKNYTNPGDVLTGEYPDTEDGDERFWAATELYRTTGNSTYGDAISLYTEESMFMRGLGWTEVGLYGCYAALMNPKVGDNYSADNSRIAAAFDAVLSQTKSNADASPYGINRSEEFEWGSNMGIANDGMLFIMADRINKSDTYKTAAKRQLSYLLGENATGYCFVTGFGEMASAHPHHRPSQAVGKAVPGMLVGGPDSALEDPYAKSVLAENAPAKCYADSDQSYSTNEVTIYWNSPLIYLLTAVE